MAHTKVTKNGTQNNGTANTFSYSGSFDVFKASEVQVTLNNIALTFTTSTINESASPREYTVDYNGKTVHIGDANLTSDDTVVIQPVTDMGAPTPRATYEPGASVTSTDLNNNQLQLMRKAMEYNEQKLSSNGGTMTGNLHLGQNIDISFEGDNDNTYETTLTVADPTADRTITLPNVTGTVVTTGDTGTVATGMVADSAITTAKIGADAITAAKIGDDVINSEHYVAGSIDTEHIADAQITAAKLQDGSVTSTKLGTDSVVEAKIVNANVTAAKLATNSVTTDKIADLNVTTGKLADDVVTTAKIADLQVTGAKIANAQVNTAQLTDAGVSAAKLASNAVTSAKIAADAIDGSKIADGSIDSEHFVSGSIDTAHIGNSQVTTDKIADANVTENKIATNAVTQTKIADNAVIVDKIVDGAIINAKLGNTSVNSTKLASNAVTSSKITDANVTTVKIADSNVTLAKLASDLKQTTIADSDTQLPTSGAVVDYVAAQIAPIGGLEVIATDAAFPNTQPASGVVISIADAGGLVVNGSGVSTTGRTVGGSTVTINNINSAFNSSTVDAGVSFMVSSTGSSQTYNFHKATLKEADILNLSNDINDFGNRYRVNAGEPSDHLHEGDLVYDTNADKMKVYDTSTSAWKEVTSTGDFKFLFLCPAGGSGAPTLNGSIATYDLRESSNSGSAASVTNAAQLMVSINGVVQKPNTGTSAPSEGFAIVDANTIVFGTNLASGDSVFIIQSGSAVSIPTPGDGTVSAAKITSGAVTEVKIADDAVTAAKLADNSVVTANIQDANITAVKIGANEVTTAKIAADAVDGTKIADDSINSEHYVDGSIDTAHIADSQITSAKIADGTIATGDIADDAVTADKLANTAVSAGTYGSATAIPAITVDAQGRVTGASTNTVSAGSAVNYIVNGNMAVAQRYAGTPDDTNGWASTDRFRLEYTGTSANPTQAQITLGIGENGTTPLSAGIRNAFRITNGNQGSAATGAMIQMGYAVLAKDLLNSGWTYDSASSYLTLSYYVRSSVAGTFYGRIYTALGGGKALSWSTGALTANTWKRVTVQIPGNGSFSIASDLNTNTEAFFLYFNAYAGTSKTDSSASSSWINVSGSNQYPDYANADWYTTNGATMDFTGVQLEIGQTASDFVCEPYMDTFRKCQQYYFVAASDNYENLGIGLQYYSGNIYTTVSFPVTMIYEPTLIAISGSSGAYVYQKLFGNTAEYHHEIAIDAGRTGHSRGVITMSGNSTRHSEAILLSAHSTGSNAHRFVAFQAELS